MNLTESIIFEWFSIMGGTAPYLSTKKAIWLSMKKERKKSYKTGLENEKKEEKKKSESLRNILCIRDNRGVMSMRLV